MPTDTKPGEWVIYHPPKSVSFGHQARVTDARKAWKLTQKFLTVRTDFALGHRLTLMCHGPSQYTEASVASARLAAAKTLFGPESPTGPTYPVWDLRPDQLSKAIDFSLDDDKFPKQASGPTTLHFLYRFTWKGLDLPFVPNERRDVQSTLGIQLGGSAAFLQPRFVFPASWNSEILRTLLALIEPDTPFRFRDQYFQRWLSPSRKGNHGATRKLDKNWRSAWQVH